MSIYCETTINHFDGATSVPLAVEVGDGRSEPLSWADQGFECRTLPSAVTDWDDPAEVETRYHAELAEMVAAEVSCDTVVFYPPIVRSPAAAANQPDFAPIATAHSDYTEDYRAMLATSDHPYLRLLAPSMAAAGATPADLASATRILTLQFWRNIGPVRPDRPLALCDCTTVDRGDLIPILVESYGGVPTQFYSFLLTPPPEGRAHRWLTFPDLSVDEVIMFRSFDSDRMAADEPFWAPHASFVDPTAGPDAPARASIEARAICLFLP